jgi:hypothetical protein
MTFGGCKNRPATRIAASEPGKIPPIHPGELLSDELQEIDVSRGELARALGVVQVFAS